MDLREHTSGSLRARAVLLAAIVVAGCTAGPGATPSAAKPSAATPTTTASTAPSVAPTTASSTASPSATPPPNAAFTADDKMIAKLISSGAGVAIPQLKALNDSDPSQLEQIFLPLGVWIASQKAGFEPYTPSTCTTAAMELYADGIDRYDAIRKVFLAWRDWGAHGHAFPPGAPDQAIIAFEKALVELKAHCPV